MRKSLTNFNWSILYETQDVLVASEYFTGTISELIESNTSVVIGNRRSLKRKKWITTGLIRSIAERDRLYKIYKFNENSDSKRRFIAYRNRLNNLIRKSKKMYYKEQIENHKNRAQIIWKTINQIGGSAKKVSQIGSVLNSVGELTRDDRETAESFVDYFTGVGPDLARRIERPITPTPKRLSGGQSIFLQPTCKNEIIEIIKSLKNCKAA